MCYESSKEVFLAKYQQYLSDTLVFLPLSKKGLVGGT